LGEIEVDEELAAAVLKAGDGLLVSSSEAHSGEHSAEVQVPFSQYLFPEAKILPILIPPGEDAARTGEVMGQAVSAMQRPIVVVGTTDLTHYGSTYYGFAPAGVGEQALEWVRANDERVIDLILGLRAEEIIAETATHRNACGGGAVAGTIAAARTLGAEKGYLLEYTTSHHVMPRGPATDFVGYAAIVF
jgi:AmmeMemoRadiSam system protein B